MYVKYAGIILSDLFQVRTVNTTAIPHRKNISINIPSRAGEIYNGYKYGIREIYLTFLVRPNVIFDYNQYVTDISNALDVDAPSRLYLEDEESYYYAVPDGKVEINEIAAGVGEGKVKFICYDPFLYSDNNNMFHGKDKITAINSGTVPTYPTITTAFSKDAHFIQITNSDSGKAILVGEWPDVDKSSGSPAGNKLSDSCETTTNWYNAGNVVDSDRLVEGGVTINTGGYGIMASNFGTTKDQKWHGPAVRRNLNTNIQDFEVVATFEHDSKGLNKSNIDNTPSTTPPTAENPYGNNLYEVTSYGLYIRAGRGVSNRIVSGMVKGDRVRVTDISGGWGKVTYKGATGYSSMQYLRLVNDGNSTHRVKTNGSGLNMRTGRGTNYKILLSIPNGTHLNVTDISGGWGKTSYGGRTGYICASYLAPLAYRNLAVKPNNFAVRQVSDNTETADNKLGVIELYGFDINGQKLFKMALKDTNEWYEYTQPEVQIGNNIVLKDSDSVPAPRTKVDKDDKGNEVTVNDLSGKFGKWNEFYGNIKVRRKTIGNKHQWYCEVNKIKDNKVITSIKTSELISDSYPKGSLNHLVLYMGAYKDKEPVSMTLTHVSVNQLNTVAPEVNQKIFKNGDVLVIDCSSNMVYLNSEPYMQHLDIGSQFFELNSGNSDIRIFSDDDGIYSDVTLSERWL